MIERERERPKPKRMPARKFGDSVPRGLPDLSLRNRFPLHRLVRFPIFLTMKDMKSMKGQRTKLFKPCFSRRTLKLIRKPCLMPDSFM